MVCRRCGIRSDAGFHAAAEECIAALRDLLAVKPVEGSGAEAKMVTS